MGITHAFVSAKDQGNDATIVSKNEWNAEHVADLHSFIGDNTIGGSWEATVNDQVYAKSVTLSSPGMIMSVGAYIKGDGTHAGSFGAAVYTDNAGTPGVLAGAESWPTNAGTRLANAYFNTTARWLHTPVGVYVPAGTYWIAFYLSDNGGGGNGAVNIAYDTGTDKTLATAYVNDASVGSFTGAANRKFSIRASFLSLA